MTNYQEPFTFQSGITVKNRLMMPPMTTLQSFYDGTITTDEIHYYTERSQGVGAVITGAANVTDMGKGWPGELCIAHDEDLPGLTNLASAIKAQGAKAFVQIFHAGRMSRLDALNGKQAVSASAVAGQHGDGSQKTATPRAMTSAEIHQTVDAFGQATKRAIEAGFDGVEIHGANQYLLQQFYSPQSNQRTDEYGGDREKRFTFIKQVLDSVFAAVNQYADRPFVVGYRFSPEEFTTPGISLEDTFYLVDQLLQTPLDYLHVSLDKYDRIAQADKYQAKSILAYLHERIAGRKPLVGVGGVRNRKDVAGLLANAEFAAVGQQLLVDPTWVQKLMTGNDSDMVTGDFADAIKYTSFTHPLYQFLVPRY
ncbi:NADH-dependent flavin oxidoreductase [Secundilactobacillus pentosiphilus]|uniref:NADH-dependent flavin oxidoreductase n=1 Tax=Secundilactobacillus pentosiphilus TaxID=1714682 RepID=A0A1Z5IZA7_9LACO|nr:NADH-dependent flavin oxidoreductase [Secundilactobacillus pentosiphilus]GAX07107.1 NADH-dependent flavin oxidoreductase [Secundilactobacillus pentosiphilus]